MLSVETSLGLESAAVLDVASDAVDNAEAVHRVVDAVDTELGLHAVCACTGCIRVVTGRLHSLSSGTRVRLNCPVHDVSRRVARWSWLCRIPLIDVRVEPGWLACHFGPCDFGVVALLRRMESQAVLGARMLAPLVVLLEVGVA
eukprot:CAMPEP_0185583346 /NCGR_PEP_ID=MMETSP0434-20130131/21469_1 /TAXON_ID=626734 ORGANISM="Favella taraikaensis, Strain Fe Narragansett Bay" /NCGR_SAMPLE_ID=MMETSP0434 /ASSEMBLY_ACC=CAM_ASM_000379 /LENGTH=143 /DNA_ID=CAMNT_0028202397 /DNA_START=578 /DNA_END=1009 /DNA_ORIENTATION=+